MKGLAPSAKTKTSASLHTLLNVKYSLKVSLSLTDSRMLGACSKGVSSHILKMICKTLVCLDVGVSCLQHVRQRCQCLLHVLPVILQCLREGGVSRC